MKIIKLCLIVCLLLCGCANSESEPLRYGNTMSELVESELDKQTVEYYQTLANKEYVSASFSYHNGDMVKTIEYKDAGKLNEFFDLIDQSVYGLNLYKPGLSIDDLENLETSVVVMAEDAHGEMSKFVVYLSDFSAIRITQDTTDYLIILNGNEFNQFFDFAYVEAKPKDELIGERIWANQDTANLYDEEKTFILTDWENSKVYRPYYTNNDYDMDSFTKAMMAVFTLGCIEMPPEPSIELFTYIMNNYPVYREVNASLGTFTKEFHTLINNEEKVFYLSKEVPTTSRLMTGDQFRTAYRELFNTESNFDESKSWHYAPHWFDSYLYLKEADVYVYYIYPFPIGSSDYSGWVMGITDQSEAEGIITIHAAAAYVDVHEDFQSNDIKCVLYDQSYIPINAAEASISSAHIEELLKNYQEDLLKLEIKLKHHTDGTYSILSATYMNQQDTMKVIEPSLPILNVYKVSNSDWTPVPQFNLSGNLAREVNLQLYYSSIRTEKSKFKIYEDESFASVTEVKIDKNKEEIKSGYLYDKTANKLTDLNGDDICYIYLDQFGIDTLCKTNE